ncbi:ATP-binding response regulator [Fontivita pretiosa]|uniref:ATP-binding response regulator n=1 Tax=Fontivita pretiosa TaxID=2989684 RepID=UPI003D177AEA
MSDARASILIVDDRPEKLLALEAVLEDLDLNIVRAYNGREALRHVLSHEFAVILLDVNMPGMDGFETAQLIRQRQSSAHVPIIFLTAMSDEMHAARGYELGAVDYILTPVVPQVLRSKVAVFVDLYRKTEQVQRQAERLRQRAAQLHRLTGASLAINSAPSAEQIARIAAQTARDVIGAHQSLIVVAPGGHPSHAAAYACYSEKYATWRPTDLQLIGTPLHAMVCGRNQPLRMSPAELDAYAPLHAQGIAGTGAPPLRGLLAVPLTTRDGHNMGMILLSDRIDGEFSGDDEAILVQLSQLASVAVENTIFAEEREANRLKDEFLSTLSHELRTPLNAISGWVQLMRMENLQDDLAHGLEVIERNVKAQTKLIEDLLDVSRITTGKMRLSTRPITLKPVLLAAADAVRPSVDAKQIALAFDLDTIEREDAAVIGDPDRLQQVFWNLLSNAAKFTPVGGKITVRGQRDPQTNTVWISVSDSGEGIDPAFLPYVFERFRQADSTSARRHGGLGIGLAIVRHIVELHGGQVQADSAGHGCGATFTIRLPLASVASPPRQQQRLQSQEQGIEPQTETRPLRRSRPRGSGKPTVPGPRPADQSPPPERASDPPGPQALAGYRILAVDDEADAREVLSELLGRFGGTIATAADVEQAMSMIPSFRPDVILTDLAMPGLDGYALLQRVRGSGNGVGDLPVVALTAYARPEDRVDSLRAGFGAHVAKPIDPAELIEAIRRIAQARSTTPAESPASDAGVPSDPPKPSPLRLGA